MALLKILISVTGDFNVGSYLDSLNNIQLMVARLAIKQALRYAGTRYFAHY